MNTKGMFARRGAAAVPFVALFAAGTAFWACSGEFRTVCPEGTTQTAGGGDIDTACTRNGQLAGQAGAGGDVGAGAAGGTSGGTSGVGGAGGNVLPVPAGGVCNPNATKCESGAQQTCGADGLWGAAQGCELACDGAGAACVVPVQLALGASHGCARMSDGTVRCWGAGKSGQLGNSSEEQLTPKPVEGLAGVVGLVAGDYDTCALLSDKTVSCWGISFTSPPSPSADAVVPLGVQDVKAVTIGAVSLCVLTEQNVVLCKGDNWFGQLGNLEPSTFGTPSDVFVPAQGEYGASLIQLGSLEDTHYALTSTGRVFCWGVDQDPGSAGGGYYCNGQGDNPATPLNARVVGKPRQLTSPDTVNSLAGGSNFACVVRADGQAMCWGRNHVGQLGRGTTSSSELVAFTLGLGATRSVSLGREHACALTTDDKLFCWGRNDLGQLGAPCGLTLPCRATAEGTSYVYVPTRVLEGVADVQAGYDFTCARQLDATVACWGSNATGQLGNGTKSAGESTPKPILWK